jgi:hypothetical protein
MKRVLLIIWSVAFGQAGYIALFFDQPAYSNRCYDDLTAALVPVYVVHQLTPGATASQFMVVSGGGFNCVYTGEIIAVPVSIGSTQSGISVSYGGCVPSTILIATMNYFCQGISPANAYLEVVPDPAAPTGTIEVVDCSFVKLVAYGGRAYFNTDQPWLCVDPTRQTSWGAVKALYE